MVLKGHLSPFVTIHSATTSAHRLSFNDYKMNELRHMEIYINACWNFDHSHKSVQMRKLSGQFDLFRKCYLPKPQTRRPMRILDRNS